MTGSSRRRDGWIVAAIIALSLVPAAAAAAGVVKKAVKKVCADTSMPIPDGPEAGDFMNELVSTGKVCPKKLVCGYGGLPVGAAVLDVDAKVRVSHPSVGDLNVLLVNPTGGMTTLSARSGGGGAGLGGGSTDCRADFTIFDDAALTTIEGIAPGLAPFAGRFGPQQPLAGHNRTYGAGDWRFYFDDVVAGNAGTVEAIGLKVKYRYIVRKRSRQPVEK